MSDETPNRWIRRRISGKMFRTKTYEGIFKETSEKEEKFSEKLMQNLPGKRLHEYPKELIEESLKIFKGIFSGTLGGTSERISWINF